MENSGSECRPGPHSAVGRLPGTAHGMDAEISVIQMVSRGTDRGKVLLPLQRQAVEEVLAQNVKLDLQLWA